MQVAIAVVTSVDSKITRGDDPNIYEWVSPADQEHFRALIAEHEVMVMGRKTYTAVKHRLNPSANLRRVILTSRPEQFTAEAVTGKLEFSSEKPADLLKRLDSEGVTKVLLVGGTQMMTDFLDQRLVDRLYLTVEPYLFGEGQPITTALTQPLSLRLVESRKLGTSGTLLLTYDIVL